MPDILEVLITGKDELSGVLNGTRNSLSGLASIGGTVLAAGLAVGTAAVAGLAAGLALCIKDAAAEEVGIQKLGAAVTASGGDWDTASVAIEDYLAAQLRRAALDDGEGREALSRLTTATGDYQTAMELLPIAMDLAAAKGMDLATASEIVGKVAEGNTSSLSRYGITLEKGATATEALAELQRRFAGQAEAYGNTMEGQQKKLSIAFGNLKETIGAALLPVVTEIMGKLSTWAMDLMPKVERAIAVVTPYFDTLVAVFEDLFSGDIGLALDDFFEGFYDGLTALGVNVPVAKAAIAGLIDTLQNVFETVKEFVTEHAEAFKNALIAIGAVIAGATIAAGIASIGGAIAALANPVTAVIVAVGLLAAAWTEDWGGIRTTLTEWWDTSGKLILDQLVLWLGTNIPLAITTLTGFWTGTLQPALTGIWAYIQDPILPTLAEVVSWFATNIPVAMQALVSFWEDTLSPAFTAIWAYINDPLIPIIGDVVTWFGTNVPLAMKALTDFWNVTLKPALVAIWAYVNDPLIPIIRDVVTWLGTNVPLAMAALVNFWTGTLAPAFTAIWAYINDPLIPIIEDVVDWLGTNIPKAMQAIEDFWNNTLHPALIAIWAYIQDPLLVILDDLAVIGFGVVTIAMRALTDFWTGTLKPALEAIWAYISGTLLPMIQDLAELGWAGVKLAMKVLTDFWNDPLKGIFAAMVEAAKKLAEKLGGPLADAWNAVKDAASLFWDIISKCVGWASSGIGLFFDGMASAIGTVKGVLDGIRSAIEWILNNPVSSTPTEEQPSVPNEAPPKPSCPTGQHAEYWDNTWVCVYDQQHMALGTSFFSGGLALVGEQGPELVNLPRGAAVHTASETRNIRNSTHAWNITINTDQRGSRVVDEIQLLSMLGARA